MEERNRRTTCIWHVKLCYRAVLTEVQRYDVAQADDAQHQSRGSGGLSRRGAVLKGLLCASVVGPHDSMARADRFATGVSWLEYTFGMV